MGMDCNRRCLHCRHRLADLIGKKKQAMKAPCKNCERRVAHPNCHATCQEYKDFVNSRKEYLDQKKSGSLIAEYIKLQKKKVNHRG